MTATTTYAAPTTQPLRRRDHRHDHRRRVVAPGPPPADAHTATKFTPALTHLVATAIVIPALASRLTD
jgi:hypothetical protein